MDNHKYRRLDIIDILLQDGTHELSEQHSNHRVKNKIKKLNFFDCFRSCIDYNKIRKKGTTYCPI